MLITLEGWRYARLEQIIEHGMRSRTLILSLVALCGCAFENPDLVITSDLGEKIIIKDSAVTTAAWGAREAHKVLANEDKTRVDWASAYENCRRSFERSGLSNDYCSGSYSDQLSERSSEDAALKAFIDNRKPIKLVTYRAISVDLNGKRTADPNYSTVACISKDIQGEIRQMAVAAAAAARLDTGEGRKSGTINEQVFIKVCDKYGQR
jgi:hypothetical protein